MDKCTEQKFLEDVPDHAMTILRDEGVFRHIRFRKPGTIVYGFDLITWPGHLCYTGDMGTYVFARIDDMFKFFRTDRVQPKNGQTLFINLGYWAEKVIAEDRHGKIEEFDQDIAKKKLLGELKEFGGTREERREIYDSCCEAMQEGELSFREELGNQFQDSWEWDLTDYTYRFTWACFAIAWGIQRYDDAKDKVTQAEQSEKATIAV